MNDASVVPVLGASDPKGPIEFRKLDVSVRETDYIAGKQNVTAIVIRNTYPTPIRLLAVTARHSTLNSSDDPVVYTGTIRKRIRPSSTRIRIRIPNLFQRSRDFIDFLYRTSDSVSTEPMYITAEGGSVVSYDDLPLEREVYLTAKEGSKIESRKEHQVQDGRGRGKIITTMSEAVSEYVWKTNHWLLFLPARIGIDIEVQYKIADEIRSQVVSTLFDIKPPIQSVVLGGIAGGIIGSLARSFTEADTLKIDTRFFVKLFGSCLLSIMAVISLSRKSGAQSFITVEDFFGAFVLGSLIGYEGTTFFEKTVINPKDVNTSGG
jgi:hypothetical protein